MLLVRVPRLIREIRVLAERIGAEKTTACFLSGSILTFASNKTMSVILIVI